MISFKQFIQEYEVLEEGKFRKAVAGALIAGTAIGAAGGAKIGTEHRRMKDLDDRIQAVIASPNHPKIKSEIPKDKMGDFSKAIERDDFADNVHASGQHHYPQHDPDMKHAKIRVVEPSAEFEMKAHFPSTSGKFGIRSGPPAKGINKWHDGTKVDTSKK